jgi:uncharacterized membrane protein HdeD (DUF308 family)
MNAFQPNYVNMAAFSKHWVWFLVWGIALMVLGLIALSNVVATTVVSIVMLGMIILAGGIIVLLNTFTFWWGEWSGFFLHLIISLLYIGVGIMLIKTPVISSVSITLLLGVFYILVGISRIVFSSSIRVPKWKWSLFNGIVTLLLGLLIMTNWPASSLYIIGIIVAIDLIFAGWAYIMTSLTARTLA